MSATRIHGYVEMCGKSDWPGTGWRYRNGFAILAFRFVQYINDDTAAYERFTGDIGKSSI
jgi:hypothetical protein